MAMQITQAEAEEALSLAARARAHVKRMKDEIEETVSEVVTTMEVGITAGGFGVLRGYTGGVEIAGAPVEAIVGIGGHLVTMLGGAGKMRPHVAGFADGAIASWLNTLGAGIGARLKARSSAGTQMSGASGTPMFGAGSVPSAKDIIETATRAVRTSA